MEKNMKKVPLFKQIYNLCLYSIDVQMKLFLKVYMGKYKHA